MYAFYAIVTKANIQEKGSFMFDLYRHAFKIRGDFERQDFQHVAQNVLHLEDLSSVQEFYKRGDF